GGTDSNAAFNTERCSSRYAAFHELWHALRYLNRCRKISLPRFQMMNLTLRCLLIVLTLASTGYGQNPTPPAFEVASVRVSNPDILQASCMATLNVTPGGTLRISNRGLDEIIMVAYGIGGNQLSGARWLTELTTDPRQVTRFEIIAKVPENA